MTTTLAQYIDQYANAVANLRLAQDRNESPERLKLLKDRVGLAGWTLRHLGIAVLFEGFEE